MTATVKLAGTLPDDHGLAAVADTLIDEPNELHLVVAILSTKKLTTDVETGDVVPTAHIRRIEVVGSDVDESRRLVQLMRRQLERRTGKTVLPLDLEDDLRSILGVNPETGEVDGDQ